MKTIRPLLLRALAVLICGASFTSVVVSAQVAPPPKQEKKYVPYRISRGDTLNVEVIANGEREFAAGQKRIEATGMINLLYIHDIRLVGLTLAEAQDAIANAYREGRFIRNPVVNVTVETYAPRVVRISGKVNSQATFEIPSDGELTIMELIFKANGFQETAKGTEVRVTRTMPDGSLKVYRLDVESAMKGKLKTPSGDAAFILAPDDVVYVPERII